MPNDKVQQFEQISEVSAGFSWTIFSEAPYVEMMYFRIPIILLTIITGRIDRFQQGVINCSGERSAER